jgi:hypothetical protein
MGLKGPDVGMWRSLVAHLTGGQGVAGSNPVIPTKIKGPDSQMRIRPSFFSRPQKLNFTPSCISRGPFALKIRPKLALP